MKKIIKFFRQVLCIRCHSENVIQTSDHSDKGFNGYRCNDCGQTWGD